MVDSVVGGRVEDPLKRAKSVHNLSVNPELVDQVELAMDHVDRRWNGHTEGHIEQLNVKRRSEGN